MKQIWCVYHAMQCSDRFREEFASKPIATLHVKTTHRVISTPNLLHTHTFYHIGVSMEQIWCVYIGSKFSSTASGTKINPQIFNHHTPNQKRLRP